MCICGKYTCSVNQKLTYLEVREFVMKFLMGLNKSFAQVKTQVLLMDPLPPMNKVYSLLIQEEMQRNFGNGSYSRVESTQLAMLQKGKTSLLRLVLNMVLIIQKERKHGNVQNVVSWGIQLIRVTNFMDSH